MKRIYRPYWTWEDYQNGMWSKVQKDVEKNYLIKAIKFTSDYKKYGKAMQEVVKKWENTMLHNLTNKNINRLAFVGHCAVTYKICVPEYITRMAWSKLTDKQKYLANEEAKKAIKHWEINIYPKNKQLHKILGDQLLLQWDS